MGLYGGRNMYWLSVAVRQVNHLCAPKKRSARILSYRRNRHVKDRTFQESFYPPCAGPATRRSPTRCPGILAAGSNGVAATT